MDAPPPDPRPYWCLRAGIRLRHAYLWPLSVILLSLTLVSGSEAKIWTIQELQTLRFPHQTSNDIYLDVCKASGFIEDVALTEEDVEHFRALNRTLQRLNRTAHELGLLDAKGAPTLQPKTKHVRQLKNARRLMHSVQRKRGRRAATARSERIWEHGVIPYEIQANFSGEHKALFRRAMRHWENHTCISFVERAPEDTNYIVFTVAECGCCSFVGKRGDGPQAISIGKNCDKFGIVVHELGHVVGFWHEHTRPDRDQHVKIYYQNIQQEATTQQTTPSPVPVTMDELDLYWYEQIRNDTNSSIFNNTNQTQPQADNWHFLGQDYNFEKLKDEDVNSLGAPYDYASIMHYARDTFSRAMYLDTILPIPDPVTNERKEIGQRLRLSPGDIRQANLLYKCSACGRTLMKPRDAISLPTKNELESEDDDWSCEWRIIATKGERIMLNVTALDLPETEDCDNENDNYLEIRDGHYLKSKLIGRFCGSLIAPEVLMSSANRLWLHFKSSGVASSTAKSDAIKDEFFKPLPRLNAHYHVICGGYISSDEGMLQSPNYPDEYRPDQDCVWYLTVPDDYQVALIFQMFQLEQHNECIYDRLEVYDGHGDDAVLIGKYCGYNMPADVKTESNKMKIRFFSDNSVEKPGFSLQFIKEFDECKTNNHGCEHICVNTLGGFRCDCEIGFELHVDGKTCEDACGGYIKADNGTLTSPNFPQQYPANKRCIWEIEANPQYRITLNFTHFDMEGMQSQCEYDFVKVTSVSATGKATKVHGTYCSRIDVPFVLTSETNRLRVEFSSDTSVQKSGFGATFFTDRDECDVNNGGCEQVCRNTIGSYSCECESGYVLAEDGHNCKEGGCKHELNAASGRILSPNYPHTYLNKETCVWHFVTTPGHRIELEFSEFEVEPHQQCKYDSVKIFDGSSDKDPLLGVFCGPKTPDRIVSSSNQLYMLFDTDNSVSRKGFLADYTSVCGGTLQAEHTVGYIYSHALYGGSNYRNKMSCDWTIYAKDDMGVQLRFTNFDLEEEGNCDYDFVKIYDGDESSSMFGRYCGKKLPPVFVSSGQRLTLLFRSDDTVERKGFVVEYFLAEPLESQPVTEPPVTQRPPLEPIINEKDNKYGN